MPRRIWSPQVPGNTHNTSYTFLLLGESNCANPNAITQNQIAHWQNEGFITYLGACEDVRPHIESSSCVVLPSFYKEGLPRVLLEAMSMGKPIITTDVSGCRECIFKPHKPVHYDNQHFTLGANGILIPARNVEALKAAMAYLYTHSALVKILGMQGRALVKKHFAIELVADIYTKRVRYFLQHSLRAPTLSLSQAQIAPTPTALTSTLDSVSHSPIQPSIVCVSNTAFGMYNFRLQPLLALQKQGFIVHIIAPFDSTTPKLKSYGFICHTLSIDSKSLNPFKDLHTMFQLSSLFRAIQPGLIFHYTIKPAIYGSFVARILGIPSIAVITGLGYVFIDQGSQIARIKKKILRSIVCGMYKVALKKAKEVWFLNPDDRAEFLSRHLISIAQSRLLPSEGVDTEHFSPQKTSTSAKNENGFTFILIARMLWDKGVGEFVEAARILKEELVESNGGGVRNNHNIKPKARFILLGSLYTQNPSAISPTQIQQWQSEGIIEYIGAQSDVRPFIESSSCVVLPSYKEGAPMVLLEAMSMGKPIITTDVSGCRMLVADSKQDIGLLCPCKNAPALANAMRTMLSLSPKKREAMGTNARAYILARHKKAHITTYYVKATRTYIK